jgi:predicted RNA-binding Zn ribbon-like protein
MTPVTPGFKFVGGSLCLDFVNTVGGRDGDAVLRDKLPDIRSLAAWGEAAGILRRGEGRSLTRRMLGRAIRLREAIYGIGWAEVNGGSPLPGDMRLLDSELSIAARHRRVRRDASGFLWAWDPPESPDRLLWTVAQSVADLLVSDHLSRLRICGGEECGWMFLDTSRNQMRQWCDMQDCGNRAKVRRFRERRQTSYSKVR